MKLDKTKWKKVRFGDLVEERKLTVDAKSSGLERYIAGEHMMSEDVHLKNWGTIGEDYLGPAFHRKFEPGDILYGSRRTYLKKVAVADFEGVTANTTFVLTPRKDAVDERLLPFLMLSDAFTEHSVKNSKGSVNPYINYKDIAKYEFLLPPKDQQARIAELLWAADDVVQKYERDNEKCELIYKCLLKEFRLHKSDSGVLLGDLITLEYGQPLKETDRIKGEFPVVGSSGITDSHHKYILEGPGIVIGRKGSAGVVTWVNDNFWPIDTAFWVKIENNAYDLKFLYYLLTSLELPKLAITTAVPGINREDVHYQKVKTFTRDQQKKIITKFTNLENVMSASNKQLQNSQLIQKQLINQVFG